MQDEQPIQQYVLDAAGRALKFQILGAVNSQFVHSNISIDTLASRLGWSKKKVVRFLEGRTKATIDNIAEVTFAIDGSLAVLNVVPRERTYTLGEGKYDGYSSVQPEQDTPVQDSERNSAVHSGEDVPSRPEEIS